MTRRAWLLLLAACWSAPALADRAEWRIGRQYWARPPLSDRSVEFHADVERRQRSAVYDKTRFRIDDIEFDRAFPHPNPVYRVSFADGRTAYIGVADFERQLYRELRPNEFQASPSFEPPLGRGIQVHTFERSALFEADPDLIWSRVKDQGPRTFTPLRVPRSVAVPVPAPVITRESHPVEPVIGPR